MITLENLNELNIKTHLNKTLQMPGIIKKVEKPQQQLTAATFECKGCLRTYEVNQTGDVILEPSLCPDCGSRNFIILSDYSEFKDTQNAILTNSKKPNTRGYRELNLILENNLVNTILKDDEVIITGELRVAKVLNTKQDANAFKQYLYVHAIEQVEHPEKEIDFVDNYDEVDPTSRESPEYISWRDSVLSRDGHECQCCGLKKHLHAHHIFGYEENPELRLKVSNGITLCQFCHDKYHSVYGLKNINPANFAKFMRRFSNGRIP